MFSGIDLAGASPKHAIVFDGKFSKEQIKAIFLHRGQVLTGQTIFSLNDFSLKLLTPLVEKEKILKSQARQALIRELLLENQDRFPLFTTLFHQGTFWEQIDRGIQEFRMTYASQDQLEAMLERIAERRPALTELIAAIELYEESLKNQSCWDLPRLLTACTGVLSEPSIELTLPEKVFWLSGSFAEGRLLAWKEALASRVELVPLEWMRSGEDPAEHYALVNYFTAHTVHDAAEFLGDKLAQDPEYALLLSEDSSSRRAIRRVLEERGIPLQDPRDPREMRLDEDWRALRNYFRIPLHGWAKKEVSSYLIYTGALEIAGKMEDSGFISGFLNLQNLLDDSLKKSLQTYCDIFGAWSKDALSLPVFVEKLLQAARVGGLFRGKNESRLHRLVQDWLNESGAIGQLEIQKNTREWFHDFFLRHATLSLEPPEFLNENSVEQFRFGTLPVPFPKKVLIFGLNENQIYQFPWSYFGWNVSERDLLSGLFPLQSSYQWVEQKIQELNQWIFHAEEVQVLDFLYGINGERNRGIHSLLNREAPDFGEVHPRWQNTYQTPRTSALAPIHLGPLVETRITATSLDDSSRCTFLGLTRGRWKLRNGEEASYEPDAALAGTVLHEAVRWMLKAQLGPQEALDRALTVVKKRRWMQSPRMEKFQRRKWILILENFAEAEHAYQQQSGAQRVSLDEQNVEYPYGRYSVIGRPDRIDRTEHGLLMVDYKSSKSSATSARKILEQGYRLQLPAYTLAASRNEKIAALQYIVLDPDAPRNTGIFPKEVVGKEPGKLLSLRSNSVSLVDESMEKILDQLKILVDRELDLYTRGVYQAKPKVLTETNPWQECTRCQARDLCHQNRRTTDDESDE